MEAQDGPVKMCQFARNGTKILSCDVSGRVYVWSVLSEVILSLIRKWVLQPGVTWCSLVWNGVAWCGMV